MSWKLPRVALLLPLCLGFRLEGLGPDDPRNPDRNPGYRTAGKRHCPQNYRPVRAVGAGLPAIQRPGVDPHQCGRSSASHALGNGRCRLRASHRSSRAALYRRAEKGPQNANAYLGRAAAELALKQHDKVLADCGNQALKINPNWAAAFHLRAPRLDRPRNSPNKAIADLTVVLRLEPDRADAYRLRGDMRQKQKDYEQAAADYSRLLRLSPHDCKAYDQRGFCRYGRKEIVERRLPTSTKSSAVSPKWATPTGDAVLAWLRLREFTRRAEDDLTENIRHPGLREPRPGAGTCSTPHVRGNHRQRISEFCEFPKKLPAPPGSLPRPRLLPQRARAIRQDPRRTNQAVWIDPTRSAAIMFAARTGRRRSDRLALADFDAALKLETKFAAKHRKRQIDVSRAQKIRACHGAIGFRPMLPVERQRALRVVSRSGERSHKTFCRADQSMSGCDEYRATCDLPIAQAGLGCLQRRGATRPT